MPYEFLIPATVGYVNKKRALDNLALFNLLAEKILENFEYVNISEDLASDIDVLKDNYQEYGKDHVLAHEILRIMDSEKYGDKTPDFGGFSRRCQRYNTFIQDRLDKECPEIPDSASEEEALKIIHQYQLLDTYDADNINRLTKEALLGINFEATGEGIIRDLTFDASSVYILLKAINAALDENYTKSDGTPLDPEKRASFLEVFTEEISFAHTPVRILNTHLRERLLRLPVEALLIIVLEIQKSKNVMYNKVMSYTFATMMYEDSTFNRAWVEFGKFADHQALDDLHFHDITRTFTTPPTPVFSEASDEQIW